MLRFMQTEHVFGHVLISGSLQSIDLFNSEFLALWHCLVLVYLGKYVLDIDGQVSMGTAKSSYNTEAKPSRAMFKSDSLELRRT